MDATPLFRPGRLPAADRLLVILSDIEMGAGGPLDDFPHSDLLAGIVLGYNDGPFAEIDVDLVFNGDTFDLLKTPFRGGFPRHITADVALGKLEPIARAHAPFFASVKSFLGHSRAQRRVHFIAGNHDAELLFPEVQQRVRQLCGDDARISFPGFRLKIGKIFVEHGSQHDRMFEMDEQFPFVELGGEQILNISWGAAALLDAVLPLNGLLAFHDRLKPKTALLELIPEIRELLMERFRSYWLHDFWKGYFRGADPTRKVTWSMLKEVIWRLTSGNAEVLPDDKLLHRMTESDQTRLFVLGHMHEPRWTSHGDRKVLQAGCLRNEYMICDREGALRLIPKSYVEVYLRGGEPVVSHFVEFEGPAAPEGYLPASIFDVVPAVRALISRSPPVPIDGPAGQSRHPRASS